jgi:hypothetical protein
VKNQKTLYTCCEQVGRRGMDYKTVFYFMSKEYKINPPL